ncbi:MAG: small ribosomal subunit Rsm22 family protein [Nitrospiraceae bacterium]
MAFNPAQTCGISLSPPLLQALDEMMGVENEKIPAALSRTVADLSRLFTAERRKLPAGYLDDRGVCAAYASYYLPVNLAKVQSLLAELPDDAWSLKSNTKGLSVLDLGCGPGTAAVAVLDWLHQTRPFAHLPLQVLAVDRSIAALKECERLWNTYRSAASVSATLDICHGDLERAVKGPTRTAIERHAPYDLIIMANCLNELFQASSDPVEQRSVLIQDLLTRLQGDGTLMIIEPALRPVARDLHRLRDRLLFETVCTVYSPCLHDHGCPALVKEDDWCHEERPWAPPPHVQAIDREVGFIKDALKFSYLLLRTDGRSIVRRASNVYRVVSELREMKGEKRVWLCNDSGRPEVGRLDRAQSVANSAMDHWHRGAIVKIEEIVRKERQGKESSLGRIPASAKVEIVRHVGGH